jgi:predicted nucleic acid-binding protein
VVRPVREEQEKEEDRRVKEAITLDTGALIALERGDLRMGRVFVHARAQCIPMFTPADAVAEWWRGRTDVREKVLRALVVEPLSARIAKIAGEGLAAVKGATTVDAIVMATAALRGGVVYTSDLRDLERLRSHFRGVRVLSV